MTKEVLLYKIDQLKLKRANAHNNPMEQERINSMLNKLYDLWYLMNEQEARKEVA